MGRIKAIVIGIGTLRRLPTVMANNDRLRAGRERLLNQRRPASNAAPAAEAQPPAASAAPVRIYNDDDYARLPSGAMYQAPDGSVRRKS